MSRSTPKQLELLGFTGFPLIVGALLVALHGLPTGLGLMPPLVLGTALGWALTRGPDSAQRKTWRAAVGLGCAPLFILALSRGAIELQTWTGLSLGVGLGLLAGIGLGRVLRSTLPSHLNLTRPLLGTALGLIPVCYGILPRLGPELTAVLAAAFCSQASSASPNPNRKTPQRVRKSIPSPSVCWWVEGSLCWCYSVHPFLVRAFPGLPK